MNPLESSWFEVVEDPKLTIYSESDSPATQSDSDEDLLAHRDSDFDSPDTSVGSLSLSSEEKPKFITSFISGTPKFNITFLVLLLFLTPAFLCQVYFFRKAILSLQSTYASKFASYDRYLTRNEYITKTMIPVNQVYDKTKGFSLYFVEENRERLLAVDADHVIVIKWPSFVKSSCFHMGNSLTRGLQSSKTALQNISDMSKSNFVALTKKLNSKNWNLFANIFNKKRNLEKFRFAVANLKNILKDMTSKGFCAFKDVETNLAKGLSLSKTFANSCKSYSYASLKAFSASTAAMLKIISDSTWTTIRASYQNVSKSSLEAVRLANSLISNAFGISSQYVQNNTRTLTSKLSKYYFESNNNLRNFFEEKYYSWNEPITVCKKGFFTKNCIQREKTFLEKLKSVF